MNMIIAGVILYVVVLLITLAFCKVSHRADEDIEEIIKDKKTK